MKMRIQFNCDNAAFEDQGNEIAWILKKLADKIESYEDNQEVSGAIVDSNGNKVGFYERTRGDINN